LTKLQPAIQYNSLLFWPTMYSIQRVQTFTLVNS